jgi:tetratricopeptide (TPR) repeat protein
VKKPEAPPPAHEPEPVAAQSGGMDVFGDFAQDMASTLDGMAVPEGAAAATPAASPRIAAASPTGPQGASQLSGLLAEMEDSGGGAGNKDDPETHYNLGVAFREMGLLDEAIGEFQKLVKGAGKGNYPPNFLQACSLLAICFMEKKMPAIAVKWYLRALETPGLDEEALMALQYDLGLAYEQAGDSRNALERFTEVYSQNIDFRDVAEKIRELQQKA